MLRVLWSRVLWLVVATGAACDSPGSARGAAAGAPVHPPPATDIERQAEGEIRAPVSSRPGASAPADALAPAGAAASAAQAPGSPDAGVAAGPEPVGGTWVSCYGRYRPTSTPRRDVLRLGLLCGPVNGMRLVGWTIEGEATDAATEHGLDLDAGDCLRVFAVSEQSVLDFSVEVRDPKGGLVAADRSGDRWPILNPDGPFCVMQAGRYALRVRTRQGGGRYAMQVWKLP